jgi:hypothetical protein
MFYLTNPTSAFTSTFPGYYTIAPDYGITWYDDTLKASKHQLAVVLKRKQPGLAVRAAVRAG